MNTEAYFQLLTDAWRHFRKYAEKIPLPDPVWTKEVNDKVALVDRYPGYQRLARKLATAIEDELEQLDRAAKA